ncbi:hypothetical protein GCM10023331_32300 [Algivirga pacifica]|uniref:Bacterial Ig-like domain-containing protein n=2 Tax=Algivirga pacifica TaxID=1162670 RepID=A0ABP9DKF9_9BACT
MSCDDDTDPTTDAPVVSITTADNQTFTVGDTITVEGTIEAPNELTGYVVTITDSTGNSTEVDNVGVSGPITSESFAYEIITESAGVFTFTVEATDTEGLMSVDSIMVTVEKVAVPAMRYSQVLLFVPLQGDTSTETFYSSSSNETYSRDEVENTPDPVSSTIDFGYYYGATDNASISAPVNYPTLFSDLSAWGTLNATMFKLVNDFEGFDELTENDGDLIEAAYVSADTEATGIITNLEVGNIFAFMTDENKDGGSKYGLVRVTSITGTFNQDDQIDIEVIVQQ